MTVGKRGLEKGEGVNEVRGKEREGRKKGSASMCH